MRQTINIEGKTDRISKDYRAMAAATYDIDPKKYVIISVEATPGGNIEGCTYRVKGSWGAPIMHCGAASGSYKPWEQ